MLLLLLVCKEYCHIRGGSGSSLFQNRYYKFTEGVRRRCCKEIGTMHLTRFHFVGEIPFVRECLLQKHSKDTVLHIA